MTVRLGSWSRQRLGANQAKTRERITDLVDIDDTALGALDIVIGRLQQLEDEPPEMLLRASAVDAGQRPGCTT
jgi:hypothetical protein